ncbi:MAG: Lrp/AsnC ligand binding domain-containing protein [Candidatus Dormibacteraeota bacterium]|nr:Lrp/AsnC ligand binding domain-containing protein [Candidatus Dormibacteraeota bacterium]
MITAFLLINAERESLGTLGPQLAACPGVTEVYTTTGEVDFIAKATVADLEGLADLVQDHLALLDGIIATSTHLAMRRYNKEELSAAYDLGVD